MFFLTGNNGEGAPIHRFSNLSPEPLVSDEPSDSYGFVGPHYLAGIISPRPH